MSEVAAVGGLKEQGPEKLVVSNLCLVHKFHVRYAYYLITKLCGP
jgi:hypothetical protein